MDQEHPDPLNEAAARLGQTLTQWASLAAAGWQIIADMRAQREAAQAAQIEQEVAKAATRDQWYREQERLQMEADRNVWGPARDAGWRADAGMPEIIRAWSAAMPYGEYAARADAAASDAENEAERARHGDAPDAYKHARREADLARGSANYAKEAAEAMHACEARLRQLHPHAMEHYDRHRAQGMSRPDAMWAAGKYFERDPNLYRRALGPARGAGPEVYVPTPEEWQRWRAETSLRAALWRLDDRALREGKDVFTRDEIRTILDADITVVALSPDEIDRLVKECVHDRGTARGYANARQTAAESAAREHDHHLGRAVDDPSTEHERARRLAAAARAGGFSDDAAEQARIAYECAAADFRPFTIGGVVHVAAERRRSGSVVPGTVIQRNDAPVAHRGPGR